MLLLRWGFGRPAVGRTSRGGLSLMTRHHELRRCLQKRIHDAACSSGVSNGIQAENWLKRGGRLSLSRRHAGFSEERHAPSSETSLAEGTLPPAWATRPSRHRIRRGASCRGTQGLFRWLRRCLRPPLRRDARPRSRVPWPALLQAGLPVAPWLARARRRPMSRPKLRAMQQLARSSARTMQVPHRLSSRLTDQASLARSFWR